MANALFTGAFENLALYLSNSLKWVIAEMSEEILKKYKTSIENNVYRGFGRPKKYKRLRENGGLKGEFETRPVIVQNALALGGDLMITGGVYENPKKLTVDAENFVHGSKHWSQDDVSELIAEIINEGKSGPYFGEGYWRAPRDFYTPMTQMITDGTFDRIFEKYCRQYGIKVIRK